MEECTIGSNNEVMRDMVNSAVSMLAMCATQDITTYDDPRLANPFRVDVLHDVREKVASIAIGYKSLAEEFDTWHRTDSQGAKQVGMTGDAVAGEGYEKWRQLRRASQVASLGIQRAMACAKRGLRRLIGEAEDPGKHIKEALGTQHPSESDSALDADLRFALEFQAKWGNGVVE